MRRLSTSAFYQIIFVLSLFMLIFISSITYKQLELQNESEKMLRLSDRINLELEELMSHLKDAETGQRGYIITHDSLYLQPYKDAVIHVKGSYKELDYLLKDDPQQQEKLMHLKTLVSTRFDMLELTLHQENERRVISDSLRHSLRSGNRIMFEIRSQVDNMVEAERELLAARNSEHDSNRFLTPLALLLISLFSLIIFIGSFIKINRDRKRMNVLNEAATQAKINMETERLYRTLIEGLPAALYTCDKDGYVQLYNPAAAELWGCEPVPGRDLWYDPWRLYLPDGREVSSDDCPVLSVLNGEEPKTKEIIIERKSDGVRRYVVPHPQPLYGPKGEIIGALNMMIDVTEAKKSQKALEESEIRLRIATEGTKLATWDLNLETREVIYSPRMNEIFGHNPDHRMTHEEMRKQIHPNDAAIVEEAFERAAEKGIYSYEARVVRPDGTIGWIRTEGKVLYNDSDKPYRILGTLMDCTEEHEARENIRRSEKLFKSISLNIPNSLILVFDPQYKIMTLEGDIMQKMGYSPADYEGKYLNEISPPERHAEMEPFYRRVFEGETFSVERKSEKGEDFMLHFVPIRADDGEIYAGLVIVLDITEYRSIQDKTWMLSAIVESSEDAIVSKTLEGIVTSWNSSAERIFGYTEEEMVGQPILKIIPPDRQDEEPRIIEQIRKGSPVNHFETKRLRKDGRLIDISLTLSPLKDAEGRIIGASKIARDITAQKEIDNLLQESEARFRALADGVPVFVWMSDTNQKRIFFNKGWLDFTGRSMDQEMVDGWTKGVHPDDLRRCLSIFNTACSNRDDFYMEYRLKRADGEYRWISDKGTPRYSADGHFLGYIGGCMDVHDQKDFTIELERQVKERTDELKGRNFELNQQKEFAETILDTSIDITIVYDVNMNFISFNKAAERKYGVKKEELLGKNLLEFFPQSVNSKGHSDLLRALDGELIHNSRYQSPITNLYYEDFLIPLLNRAGDVYAVLVIARDITEMVRNEEMLMHLNESLTVKNSELERSNTELASFNHVASHDLQEPLRKIQTFISRIVDINDSGLTDKTAEYFAKIRTSANRMQMLIDDLLTFSRTNKPDQQRETVDMNVTVELVQREMAQTIEEKNATITADQLPVLEGIAFQFQQLFINLIGNALKYSRPDVPPEITIRCAVVKAKGYDFLNVAPEKDYYRIAVSDNGIGFEPQYSNRIFELFQRLHGKMEYTGTGIGLTICKKIVENHNGHIMAEGRPNEGATFTIFLPV